MITGKIKRCIRCMRPLKEGEVCSFCGCDNRKLQTYAERQQTGMHREHTAMMIPMYRGHIRRD